MSFDLGCTQWWGSALCLHGGSTAEGRGGFAEGAGSFGGGEVSALEGI